MEKIIDFIFLGSIITADGDCSHEIKRRLLLGRKTMTNLDSIQKQRHYFAKKGLSSQNYGFFSSHVWLWDLSYKESWALKNWCFWNVVLEKIIEILVYCKEIKPISLKGNQSWIFFERTDVEAEAPMLWPLDVKYWLVGKDLDAEKDWRQEKGMTEDEMVGWHHRLNEHEFKQALGVGDEQVQSMVLQRVVHNWVTEPNWTWNCLQVTWNWDNCKAHLNKNTCFLSLGKHGPVLLIVRCI